MCAVRTTQLDEIHSHLAPRYNRDQGQRKNIMQKDEKKVTTAMQQ